MKFTYSFVFLILFSCGTKMTGIERALAHQLAADYVKIHPIDTTTNILMEESLQLSIEIKNSDSLDMLYGGNRPNEILEEITKQLSTNYRSELGDFDEIRIEVIEQSSLIFGTVVSSTVFFEVERNTSE